MREIMPEMCADIMSDPAEMREMMSLCMSMAGGRSGKDSAKDRKRPGGCCG